MGRPLLLRGRHRAADGGGGSVSGGPERHGRGCHACGLMLPSMRARRVRRIPVGYPWAHAFSYFPTPMHGVCHSTLPHCCSCTSAIGGSCALCLTQSVLLCVYCSQSRDIAA